MNFNRETHGQFVSNRNIKREFRLTGFLYKNISLIKAAKLPEKALLQRLAGGAALMAPRPARIKMPHEEGWRYQKMPQRDVRGLVGTDTRTTSYFAHQSLNLGRDRCRLKSNITTITLSVIVVY
ncbi:hypothetical protein [Xylella fastidiosa]|uniref:hypothetical protein n=1 Tax=Xylella fastidiosa TaxID=2371 RepID=UPI00372AF508